MPLDAQTPDTPPDSDMATPAKNLSDLWQKRRATTAPLMADLKADQSKVKELEAKEADRPDVKQEEAPKLPEADPLKGFASAAGIFAMIASALTRTPANAAMSSMAQAITAQRQGEIDSYKQHYQAWKDSADEALKLDAAHRQKVSQALDIMKTNAAEGEALLRAADTEFGDEQGAMFQSAHLAIEREQLNSARQRLAMDMENHKVALEKDQPKIMASMELASALKSGDPDKIAKAREDYAFANSPTSATERVGSKEWQFKTLVADLQAHGHSTAEAIVLANQELKPQPKTSSLSEEALNNAADYYNLTHQLPAGFGGQADRQAIMNRAAQRPGGESGTTQMTTASYTKALTGALSAVVKQKSAAEGYELGAQKEFDLTLKFLPQTPEPLDSQLLTRWFRTGETNFGNVQVAKFQTALISALDEYAKVLSGATGAAGSTDSSREQALSLIPAGATSEQIPAIISVIKQSMNSKIAGYDEEIGNINDKITHAVTRGIPESPSAKAPPAGPKDGETATSKSGKPIVYRNGHWEYQ